MNILSPTTAPRTTVETNLPVEATVLFRNAMLPELWSAAVEYGVDPVGMVAQAGHETGWGVYAGRVKPWFYNTAGIKVRHVNDVLAILGSDDGDHPLVHQQFPNWQVGAAAHAQHLRAYCNLPVDGPIVDPRYIYVIGRHQAVTWADLGGKWAPAADYGQRIEDIIGRLAA